MRRRVSKTNVKESFRKVKGSTGSLPNMVFEPDMRVRCCGLPKKFFNRCNPHDLAREHHLTAPQIAADVVREMRVRA